MIADEFLDLMPHRIRVRGTVQRDNYGYPLPNQPVLTYACLIDDNVAITFAQSGAERIIERVAYVLPYPLNTVTNVFSTTPTPIESDATVILPDDSEHEITSVATHFDETGLAHNQEVRFN